MPKGSHISWNRVLGITSMKRTIALSTGIPTTKSGRSRKMKRLWIPVSGLFWFCLCLLLIGILSQH